MSNLMKADLLRIVKDKLFLVLAIIFCAFGVVVPLFYFAIAQLLVTGEEGAVLAKNYFSASYIALSSFSPFSNIGLVLGIFMSILIYKDFSNGTVRNKIITGHSRWSIFLSNALCCIIVVVGLELVYFILSFAVGSVFFNTGITASNIGGLILTFFFEILGWIVMAMAIAFFSMSMKNAGGAIVLYIVVGLALTFIGSMLDEAVLIMGMAENPNEGLISFFNVLNGINIPYAMSSTLTGGLSMFVSGEEATYDVLSQADFIAEYLVSCGLCFAAFGGFGYLIFSKKDLK